MKFFRGQWTFGQKEFGRRTLGNTGDAGENSVPSDLDIRRIPETLLQN